MIFLPIIAMLSALTLAPVSGAASTPSYAVAAKQRLDRLTDAAASHLRERAIERGLADGRIAFETSLEKLKVRMASLERQQPVVFKTASNKPQ